MSIARDPPARWGDVGPDSSFRRFNRRFDLLQHWLIVAFAFIFAIVVLTQHVSVTMCAIHLAIYAAVVGFCHVTRPRDAMASFMVTYSFWFYSFALFAYALIHWQSPEDDLYSPWLSSMVAAVTLAGCMAGYAAYRLVVRIVGPLRVVRAAPPAEQRLTGMALILVSAPLTVLPFAGREVSLFNAIAGMAEPLLWLGLIVYCAGRGPKAATSWPVMLVAAETFLVSIGLNARGGLLSLGITGMMIYFAMARRPLAPIRLLLFYIGANAIGAFSTLMIGARIAVGHVASGALVLRGLFSTDFLFAALGLRSMPNPDPVADLLERHDRFLIYFYGGRGGLFERLGQLPPMDIVISYLPRGAGIDWGEVRNTLLSALPSFFGQAKQTDFSDRLVWGTRLVAQDNITHPTVTMPGEAYAMGGFPVVFAMSLLLLAATLLWYEWSKRVFGDRFVAAAALLAFSIYIVFSSTAISALFTPLRFYPVAMILFPFVRSGVRLLASGHSRGLRQSTGAAL